MKAFPVILSFSLLSTTVTQLGRYVVFPTTNKIPRRFPDVLNSRNFQISGNPILHIVHSTRSNQYHLHAISSFVIAVNCNCSIMAKWPQYTRFIAWTRQQEQWPVINTVLCSSNLTIFPEKPLEDHRLNEDKPKYWALKQPWLQMLWLLEVSIWNVFGKLLCKLQNVVDFYQ